VPHTKEQYENAVKMLDELIEKIGEDENHPLASLMETLGTLIESYENQHFPETAFDPIGVLKFLMDEHGLKQSDLPESRRFNVSPAVFLKVGDSQHMTYDIRI
jgi:HTH-type transcriptional regulator/antitoxin HigA